MQLLIDKKYRTIYFKNNLIFYKTTKGNINASDYFKKTGELKKQHANLLKSDKTVAVIKKNTVDKKHGLGLGLTNIKLNSRNKTIKKKGGAGDEKIYSIDIINISFLEGSKINEKYDINSIKNIFIPLLTIVYTYLVAKKINTTIKTIDNEKLTLLISFLNENINNTLKVKLNTNIISIANALSRVNDLIVKIMNATKEKDIFNTITNLTYDDIYINFRELLKKLEDLSSSPPRLGQLLPNDSRQVDYKLRSKMVFDDTNKHSDDNYGKGSTIHNSDSDSDGSGSAKSIFTVDNDDSINDKRSRSRRRADISSKSLSRSDNNRISNIYVQNSS